MAKKKKSSAFAVVQQIGKSFFLPVSVLPIAGILLGLGSSFTNADTIAAYHLQGIMGEGTILNALLTIMSQVGNTIFGNLPLIFALAVALGMAKNEKAVAVLSAGISFFVMNSTINAMLKLSGKILADGTYAKSVLNGQITIEHMNELDSTVSKCNAATERVVGVSDKLIGYVHETEDRKKILPIK